MTLINIGIHLQLSQSRKNMNTFSISGHKIDSTHFKHFALSILIIIFLSLTIYNQVLHYDFINFDDDSYVYNNNHVKKGLTSNGIIYAFTTTDKGNFIPLTWLSHMVDVQIFGLSPGGHHFTSLLFHILNSILLFVFLKVNTRMQGLSFVVALLFAVHPMHVESVAWISERKDMLSSFCGLAALIFYCQYAKRPNATAYGLTLVFFLASLLSKPMLVTFPVILCLLDFWPLHRISSITDFFRFRENRNLLIEKIPFFLISIIFSIIAIFSQHSTDAVATLTDLSFSLRLINAMISYVEYIFKMVWPSNLAVIYPYRYGISIFCLIISAVVLLLATWAVLCGKRKNPALVVGWLWFLIMLLPVIGLIQVGTQAMADRYTYLPSIGFFICVTWFLHSLTVRFGINKRLVYLAATTIIAIYSLMSWRQVATWKESTTLFRHALSITHNNWVAHLNYGEALIEKREVEAAIGQYKKALAIKPDFELAYLNIGVAYAQKGLIDNAIASYKKALSLKRDLSAAWMNLGNAYFRKGMSDKALSYYLTALSLKPDYAEAYWGIGAVMAGQGDLQKAMQAFKRVLEIDPGSIAAKNNIIRIEQKMKAAD